MQVYMDYGALSPTLTVLSLTPPPPPRFLCSLGRLRFHFQILCACVMYEVQSSDEGVHAIFVLKAFHFYLFVYVFVHMYVGVLELES